MDRRFDGSIVCMKLTIKPSDYSAIFFKITINFMQFNKQYFLFTCLLFLIELGIALFVRDAFIRPYGGDFLVVILLYYLVRTFYNTSATKVAIGVLLFSYVVEMLQYFHIVDLLGLKGNRPAEIIIGTGFSWGDIVAYTLGIMVVFWLDKK